MRARVVRLRKSNTDRPEAKRAELRRYFHQTCSIYDRMFSLIRDDDSYYDRHEPLRHPLIFYFGHPAVFYVNKLLAARLIPERIDPRLESMLAVGVDDRDEDRKLVDPVHRIIPKIEILSSIDSRFRHFCETIMISGISRSIAMPSSEIVLHGTPLSGHAHRVELLLLALMSSENRAASAVARQVRNRNSRFIGCGNLGAEPKPPKRPSKSRCSAARPVASGSRVNGACAVAGSICPKTSTSASPWRRTSSPCSR